MAEQTNDNSPTTCLVRIYCCLLGELARTQGNKGHIHVLTLSKSQDELAKVRTLLAGSWQRLRIEEGLPSGETNAERSTKLEWSLEYLLRFPFRVYETGNVDKIVSRHFFGEDMAGFLDTPKPKNFSKTPPYDHRWITEVSVVGHQLPRHPTLGDHVVLSPTITSLSARSGRDGTAYFCPNSCYFGGDLDETLVKPSIHLPNAISIFQRLLKFVDLDCQISDKGRFSLDSLVKFGSIGLLSHFLLTESKKAVLEKYRDNESPANGAMDEGILLQSDRRRYLDFRAVQKIIGDSSAAGDLIDDLTGKSVLHRGLILKCEFCRSTDWFSIAELSHEFRCKRCSRTQIYRQSHALMGPEPTWYYKLDEIVFKALMNDFDVPMLALNRLSRNADSFLFSPELELRERFSGTQVFELDICCIPDGKLTIGEAKKGSRLANSARKEHDAIEKYFGLAQKLGASQVVFATSSDEWRSETARLIRDRFSGCLVKPILWSKANLYQHA